MDLDYVTVKCKRENARLLLEARGTWSKFYEEEREWRRKHARPRPPEDASAK